MACFKNPSPGPSPKRGGEKSPAFSPSGLRGGGRGEGFLIGALNGHPFSGAVVVFNAKWGANSRQETVGFFRKGTQPRNRVNFANSAPRAGLLGSPSQSSSTVA